MPADADSTPDSSAADDPIEQFSGDTTSEESSRLPVTEGVAEAQVVPNQAIESRAFPPVINRSTILHWLILIVCILVLAASVILKTPDDEKVTISGKPLPEMCNFRRVLGIDCPGCGMTRAFICISKGQWQRAWYLNPVSFMMYGLIAFQLPYRIIQIIRLKLGKAPINDLWSVWYFAVLGALLMVQWLVRLAFMDGELFA